MSDSKGFSLVYQTTVVAALIILALNFGRELLLPLMLALYLSFILDPVVDLLTNEKRKIKLPRPLAITIAIIMTFLVLYGMGLVVYSQAGELYNQYPVYEQKLRLIFGQFTLLTEEMLGKSIDRDLLRNLDWMAAFQQYSLADRLISSVGSFLSFLGNVFLVIFFMIYFLVGKKNLPSKLERAFGAQGSTEANRMIQRITGQVRSYLATKTLVSLGTGLLSYFIFLAFGLDFPVIWAFLIFLLNFIPNFGSIVSSLLPLLIALVQYDSLLTVFWLGVVLFGLQLTIGNVIEPRVMGQSLNLSPLAVILSLIFWGWLWGVAGMILAVPTLATLILILENFESFRPVSKLLRHDQNRVYYR
jgi:AI-2 transport protein TqsA